MYIINASYFIGKISITNLNEPNSGMLEQAELYVDSKVRLLLRNTLNNELFEDLDSNITNGVLDNDAPEKWDNLVNGATYVKDGKTCKWQGLIYTDGLYKLSLLADFVYHEIKIDNLQKDATIQPKNAIVNSQKSHLASVWNGFVEKYQGGYGNCYKTNYIDQSCFFDESQPNTGYVSLLTFLRDNIEDYEGANLYQFPISVNSNSLGL